MKYLLLLVSLIVVSTYFKFVNTHCIHDEFVKNNPPTQHVSNVPYRPISYDNGKRDLSSFEGLRMY